MTAKTKYKRSTWKKQQLQQNMNSPHLGNKACHLCSDGSNTSNLNQHVSDSQTCADVHVQLALLRYDNAMCAVGQANYQEICCPPPDSSKVALKSSLTLMVGAVILALCFRKLLFSGNKKRRRVRDEDDAIGSRNSMGGTDKEYIDVESGSGRHLRRHHNQHRPPVLHVADRPVTAELEMPISHYERMEDLEVTRSISLSGKPKGRSRSTARAYSRSQSRPRSRSRSRSRARSRSQSRAVDYRVPSSRSQDRDQSGEKQRSRSTRRHQRDEEEDNGERYVQHSPARVSSRGRASSRPKSRSRGGEQPPRSFSRPRDKHPSDQRHSRTREPVVSAAVLALPSYSHQPALAPVPPKTPTQLV